MAAEHHDWAKKNEVYFNDSASDLYKEEWVMKGQRQIFNHFTSPATIAWLELDTKTSDRKLLDYACGPGVMTMSLKQHFARCIGVDVSSSMIEKYHKEARAHGFHGEEVRGVVGDLLADGTTDPALGKEELWNFDAVAISAALHHMHDMQDAVQKLVDRLRPGGVIVVVDFADDSPLLQEHKRGLEGDGTAPSSRHHDQHGLDGHQAPVPIHHHGLAKEKMLQLFTNAGCVRGDFVFADALMEMPMNKVGKAQIFWARAFKQS